jgi:hypothetical protein
MRRYSRYCSSVSTRVHLKPLIRIHSLGLSLIKLVIFILNSSSCSLVTLMVNFRCIWMFGLSDLFIFKILELASEPLAKVAYSRVVPSRTVVVYKSTFSTTQPPASGPFVLTGEVGSLNTTLSPISYGFLASIKRIPWEENEKGW